MSLSCICWVFPFRYIVHVTLFFIFNFSFFFSMSSIFFYLLFAALKRAASSQRFPKRSNSGVGNGSSRTLSSILHEYQYQSIELLRESVGRLEGSKRERTNGRLKPDKYWVLRTSPPKHFQTFPPYFWTCRAIITSWQRSFSKDEREREKGFT